MPQLLPELLQTSPGAHAKPNLLAFGDIDFGATLDPDAKVGPYHFPDLPGTAVEIKAVDELFHATFSGERADVLTRKEATKRAFITRAPQASCLVVCTHGFFFPDTPEKDRDSTARAWAIEGVLLNRPSIATNPAIRSGLVFAGANWAAVGRGNAFLTALEASEMDLHRVDLAVLSACESGRGQIAGGEGVVGLQRAFQVAGARTCITSLWEVDDQATRVLMTEFYTNLWQKKHSKLTALRQAQLRMLHEYDPRQNKFVSRGLDIPADEVTDLKRGSPFYWAAFVLSGDWR